LRTKLTLLPRPAARVALLTLLALLALAAPAMAESCTLGVDTPRYADRPPSACSYLDAPAFPSGQVTNGPDGAAWFIAQDGGGYHLMRRAGGSVVLGPVLPLPEAPTGIVTSAAPDNGIYVVAGSTVVRVRGVSVDTFRLPNRAASYPAGTTRLTQMVAALGRVWIPAAGSVIGLAPDGSTLVWSTPGLAPAGGLASGNDGSLWFSAGGAVGKLAPNGALARFGASPLADGPVAAARPPESDIWYGSRSSRALVRLTQAGALQSYGVYAAPTDLRSIERYAIWGALSEGTRNYLVRITTRYFRGGRPFGVRCDIAAPIACGVGLRAMLSGERPQFYVYGSTAQLAFATGDGTLNFAAGARLGQNIPFRGLLACPRLGAVVGSFRASACRTTTRWDGFVTNRPVAYARVSCLRLTFRFCGGSLRLYYGGRLIGTSTYAVQGYDNPQVRIPVSKATLNMIKARHSIVATASVSSFDQGGLTRFARYSILLYPGARDRTP
jgi:streptogramin lyase